LIKVFPIGHLPRPLTRRETIFTMRGSLVTLTAIVLAVAAVPEGGIPCTSQGQCGEGICDFGHQFNTTTKINVCKCDDGYLDWEDKPCAYAKKSKLTAFLLSFLIGGFGVDWFYLAQGSGGYIAAGIFKLITFGGFGIWYTVDWIRVLCDGFYDGNGIELQGW